MDESLERLLEDLPGEAMADDLPRKVHARLAGLRRREASRQAAGRGLALIVGWISGWLLWPRVSSLVMGWQANLDSLTRAFGSILENPMEGWRALLDGALRWGPELAQSLGAPGLVALMLLAVPALLGLHWALNKGGGEWAL
jgi:hypothetical protein